MKSNQDLPPEEREMLIVAVFWDWRLRSLNISPEEWLLFRRWHSVPAHRVMLDRVHALRKQQASARWLSSLAETSSQPAHARRWLRAAASVLVFILAQFGPSGGTLPPYQIMETASAASTRPLKDGSIVRAAPNTRIEIELSRSERALSLFRGQAFFAVAHVPGRTFVVRTPDAIIEATGTRFGVAIVGAVTVVTVTDGSVNVTPVSTQFRPERDANLRRVELNPNEQAQVSQLQAPVVSHVDSETVLAWATTIEFDEVTAVEALQQFSARNGSHLKLKHPRAARDADISGTFQLDDPIAFAAYVANRTAAIVSVSGPGHAVTDVAPRRTAENR